MPSKPADYDIANDTGANVRTDLNNVFNAIQINNGYGSEPTTKLGFMWYADTSSNKMSFYKATPSDGRISFIHLANGNFFGPNGSASDPSYTFENSASTGFYRSAANQIGVSNNSVNTALFKTTGTEIKGKLEVTPSSGDASFDIKTSGNSNDSAINIIADTTYTTAGFSITRKSTANGSTELVHRGTGDLVIDTDEASDIVFKTDSTMRLSLTGKGTSEGTLISHDHTRNTLTSAGYAFLNTENDNGAGFEMLSLVKSGSSLGSALFINRLASAGLPDTGGIGRLIEFQYNGTAVGSITTDGTNIAINGQSSDYRLKENIVTLDNAITKIKQANPIRFNYKSKTDKTYDGFLAHELQELIPSSATGSKDEVDSDGKAIYQLIDVTKLIPLTVAALKEAIAKIETLETKVAALEAK